MMRQESAYDSTAISARKAQSLLQVLPENYPDDIPEDEFHIPENSLHAGHRHLNKELVFFAERFSLPSGESIDFGFPIDFSDAVFIASAAAYNAGRGSALHWLKRNPPGVGFDWFIEDITFDETHDYVEQTFYYVKRYQQVYSTP